MPCYFFKERRRSLTRHSPSSVYNHSLTHPHGAYMREPLELKKTINLPKTDFSMRANLPVNEPKWLEKGEKNGIYGKTRESRRGRPTYILHDGPPSANGPIHDARALHKCLKEI